ncbi:MAG: chemotaxis protein CheA, partial [Actinobacteria bacterium]|nr:chemotaxis protein CheA [Actinomycetota bacterium]NIS29999.1 chemotaxis protein CheA [Actinomycetota bacterium]NIU65274.1 chemotaxis protein CheA [Actinomycetota bacterium]NIV86277.1 chemotaxis protein CheA [Actinomycetota bacterium]NIW27079.1 chemotaxis protein CheA [Actinomycetota bacterium]
LLREPLRHLVVNAVDHGIEPVEHRLGLGKPGIGTVSLVASIADERLSIVVSDDGRGIDWEAVERAARARGLGTSPSELRAHLFLPGFSTVEHPSDFSGTGEGLALIADAVDRVGGSVRIDSETGIGTTVKVDLPASLVLQSVVIVAAGDQFFGVVE